jgi:hypothetical protein
MIFCTDADLLSWEPNLLAEAQFVSQALFSVSATLAQTLLTITTTTFDKHHVRAGDVVILSGAVEGCYPIVELQNETQCSLTRPQARYMQDPRLTSTSPVGVATSGLTATVRTFAPQRMVASELLSSLAGATAGSGRTIVNPSVLRRSAVLGTLHMIYNALAAVSPDAAAELEVRSQLYEMLYRKSLRAAVVEIDTNGDGLADEVRHLRTAVLVRA